MESVNYKIGPHANHCNLSDMKILDLSQYDLFEDNKQNGKHIPSLKEEFKQTLKGEDQ